MTTLREQAAIAAMHALLTRHSMVDWGPDLVARLSVQESDALLAELARTAPKDESPLRCTAAERELIEAAIADPNGTSARYNAAWIDVYEERRAASDAHFRVAYEALQAERRAAKDALPRAGGDQ